MHTPRSPEDLILPHGGYRRLRSFQVAQLCYDVTVRFCDRYISKRSRTHDQMVQAARSGVQNIAEGSQASATSKKIELSLTNVARASLEELRLDYEDFLRQRGLPLWPPRDPRRKALVSRRCSTADDVAAWISESRNTPPHVAPDSRAPESVCAGTHQPLASSAEFAANAALVLIGVASYLLERQVKSLSASFLREGGFSERLHRARTSVRQ